jgi:hypothetical protein
MKIPLLHQQIILQTEKLRDLHRSIMMQPPPADAAEIENLLREIRSLYSIALELSNENAIQLLNQLQVAVNHNVSPLQAVKDIVQETKSPEPVRENMEALHSEPVIKPMVMFSNELSEKTRPLATKQNGHHDSFKENPTLAGSFEDHQTLGEKIAAREMKKTVSENLKIPVKDIKSIIGLNEKFQFINFLFDGDTGKYNSAIDVINSSNTAEEALEKLKDIAESKKWNPQTPSAKTFFEIIERRFYA